MAQPVEQADYTKYKNKPGTDLHKRFAHWLQEKVGFDAATDAKNKQEAFEHGVRLATTLRMEFQRSPENQDARAARQAGSEQSSTAGKKPTAKKAPAKKAPAKKAPPKKPAEEEENGIDPHNQPAGPPLESKGAPVKSAARKPRTARGPASRKPAPF